MARKVFENGDVLTPEILNELPQGLGDLLVQDASTRDISLGDLDGDFIVVHLYYPPPTDPVFTIKTSPRDGAIVLFVRREDGFAAILPARIALGSTTFTLIMGGRLLAKYVSGVWVVLDYNDGFAKGVAENSIFNYNLSPSSVTSNAIAPRAVGSTELDFAAVANENLAENSVDTAELVDLSVTTNKLDNESVTAGKLASEAVFGKHINSAIIEERHYSDKPQLPPSSSESRGGGVITPVHRRLYMLAGQTPTPAEIADPSSDGIISYFFAGSSTSNDGWPITFTDLEGSVVTCIIPRGRTACLRSLAPGWMLL